MRVLSDNYRPVRRAAAPRFGDILYAPDQHAARFLLTDPDTKRWIGLGAVRRHFPYRCWWVDEDLSSQPFAGQPDPSFRTRIALWRRDRLPDAS